ncbi:hypothetical protein BIV57_22680 [Mangrovactinospora gilvigrisea]|uniref:DUF4314 domain-containing protein n=1 Tax=Mangrovactinospora gilvigrisea TaxID=1428644 RepID=A0A1J7B989_9ACTN|nr:DUF4314 domain-containing protein [Mangrovactinospora gilvigrisea]OIV35231.1 hypothetical protein BIV57_22680 [Mangrovactinospora gilvigrisea]
MEFRRGQRITLVHTDDPHTELRPGTAGTVLRFDEDQQVLSVKWDDGSTLAMLLDEGDEVSLLDNPHNMSAPSETLAPNLRNDRGHGRGR